MSTAEPDRSTAEVEEEDADFAEEHDQPSLADQHTDVPGTEPDEASPGGLSGFDPP
ncbi:MAG TPA: hypothetical protein VGR21_05065 [Cryptosporangiaceae bacterium]|nr:hypothetical protein [Cryptosporangiaceae bacterium]